MNVRRVVVLGFGLSCLAGCGGPSVAELETRWHHDQENVQKYRGKYPTFGAALDDLLKNGNRDFDAAKAGDDKTRAEKMKGVADRVEGSLSAFDHYEKERDALAKLMKDKDLNDLPASKFNPANDAAKKAMKKADGLMDDHPANMGEAKGKLEDAAKGLHDAGAGLEALRPPKAAPPPAKAPAGAPPKKK